MRTHVLWRACVQDAGNVFVLCLLLCVEIHKAAGSRRSAARFNFLNLFAFVLDSFCLNTRTPRQLTSGGSQSPGSFLAKRVIFIYKLRKLYFRGAPRSGAAQCFRSPPRVKIKPGLGVQLAAECSQPHPCGQFGSREECKPIPLRQNLCESFDCFGFQLHDWIVIEVLFSSELIELTVYLFQCKCFTLG